MSVPFDTLILNLTFVCLISGCDLIAWLMERLDIEESGKISLVCFKKMP